MGTIYVNGIDQSDLAAFLTLINANLLGVLKKLDADSGVNDTNYESTLAITFPTTTISAEGITCQGSILSFLDSFITNYNALLAKLDADATVTDEDYASSCGVSDVVNPTGTTAREVLDNGIFQGDLVYLLDGIVTKFNAMNAKLDADTAVNGTDYASKWNIADTIDSTGA